MYFDQTLDHFSPVPSPTFPQRYIVIDSYWKPERGPVFLILGGVTSLTGCTGNLDVFGEAGGNPYMEFAVSQSALIVYLEWRFFGTSLPPSFTYNSTNLEFHTLQQSVEDTATFLSFLGKKYNIPSSRYKVVVGCSASGTLATIVRMKHPEAVNATIASSATIQFFSPYPQWATDITHSLSVTQNGKACIEAITKVFEVVQKDIPSAKKYFNMTSYGLDDTTFLYILVNAIALSPQSGSSDSACSYILNSTDVMAGMARYLTLAGGYPVLSLFNYPAWTSTSADPSNQWRGWLWLLCTQWGLFDVSAVNSIYPQQITNDYFLQTCRTLFGDPNMVPRVDELNSYVGGIAGLSKSSNILLFYGGTDAYRLSGAPSSLSNTVLSFVAEGAGNLFLRLK
jgi:hypothetical protein